MSLSRLALRLIAARAVRGQTIAGMQVYDSAVESLDEMAKDKREPFIVVLTDDHQRQIASGRDLRLGQDACELVFEVAVASRVPVTVQGNQSQVQVIVPHTDAGMEIVLDMIGYQIQEALLAGPAPWSSLWKEFAMTVPRMVSRRGASAENGIRYAARQIVMTVETMADPQRGQPVSPMWERLLTAMASDAELSGTGSILRQMIEGTTLLSDAQINSVLGINQSTTEAIGLGSYLDDAFEPETVNEVIADVENQPDTPWSLTETAADDQGIP